MSGLVARRRLILTMSMAVVVLPMVFAALYVVNKKQWAEARLSEVEPRHARLLGMESRRDELDAAASRARALLDQYAYPASMEATQAGNDAQQRLRNIFTQAGLSIASSQVLASKVEKQFDRIPISIRVEGNLIAFQSAMAVLSTQTPALLIDTVNVQTIGFVVAEKPQRLAGQLSLFVLRARP